MDGRTAEQWLKEWVEQEFAPDESPYQAITYLLDRIAELEAENKLLRKTEGHYIGCPLRVKLAAGIAPMCTPCTCNEIANKKAEAAEAEAKKQREEAWAWMQVAQEHQAALERVRWVLDEIVSAYRAYRACGVIPAPDPYQRLVEAIKCADELAAILAKRKEEGK